MPERGSLRLIILGAGSELQHAVAAAKQLGEGIRVVSMPSFFRFSQQPKTYQDWVLPTSCRQRIAIEAGVPNLWYQFVGLDGIVIGVNRFGLSGPGGKIMETLGITTQAVLDAAATLFKRALLSTPAVTPPCSPSKESKESKP